MAVPKVTVYSAPGRRGNHQADGKILIAGRFTSVNDQPVGDIVRLNPDGTTDASFNTGTGFSLAAYGTPGRLNRIEVMEDGKIIALGLFDTLNGTAANYMVRLNPDGSRDETFDAGNGAIADSDYFPVADLYGLVSLPNGQFIVSGTFMLGWNCHLSEGMVRINANGSVDPNFTTTITRLDVGPVSVGARFMDQEGRIFVNFPVCCGRWGNVATLNGAPVQDINFIDQDGNIDQDFAQFYEGIGINGRNYQWEVLPDGKVLVSGEFTAINGIPSPGVARLNADGSLDLSFDPGLGPRDQNGDLSLAWPVTEEKYGKILMSGLFTSFDGVEQPGLVRLFTQTPPPVKINSIVRNTSGVVTLDFTKTTDAAVVLEWTENWNDWFEAVRNDQVAGTYQIQDAGAVGSQRRFYRFKVE